MASADLAAARSFLFVPGHRPDRFDKAHNSGADAIIIDLEDAVGAERKDEARAATAEWLATNPSTIVRVNAPHTEWFEDDLAALAGTARCLVVPKASAATTRDVGASLPPGSIIIALIETATGVLQAPEIAASPCVIRLAVGNVDLGADIGVDPDDHRALLMARSHVVLASASAGIASPIDGVTTAVNDEAAVTADVMQVRSIGFSGKLLIHPRQIGPTHAAFAPTPDQISYAQRVVDAVGAGDVSVLDGKMLDKPVVDRARRILASATARLDGV